MKPLKKATQKNVSVRMDAYTQEEIEKIKNISGIFDICDGDYRISLNCVKDLKVSLADDGYYYTVAVMNSGETIFVEL